MEKFLINTNKNENKSEKVEIGKIDGISILCELYTNDKLIQVSYKDFSRDLRNRFDILKKNLNEQSSSLNKFIAPLDREFWLERKEYLGILQVKHSIVNRRSIEDGLYLNYLLQLLKKEELQQLCHEFDIKRFSKLKKEELIEFIVESLSEEERREYLIENEQEIISLRIANALRILNKKTEKEKIIEIKYLNPTKHEIEITFEGFNWKTTSFIAITTGNIRNPQRDCDCNPGSAGGFCVHFWIGFIISLKKGYFSLNEWNLTFIPEQFEEMCRNIR